MAEFRGKKTVINFKIDKNRLMVLLTYIEDL